MTKAEINGGTLGKCMDDKAKKRGYGGVDIQMKIPHAVIKNGYEPLGKKTKTRRVRIDTKRYTSTGAGQRDRAKK